jgi:hypothetical protein
MNALEAHALLGGGAFLPVHWGTFSLALHAWDEPAETLLAQAPARGVQLVMPRLGEPVEPVQAERVTPWWRSAGAPHAGDTVVSEAEALSVPKVAGWPLD